MMQTLNGPQLDTAELLQRTTCYLCNQPGIQVYRELSDRLYDVPGTWNLRRCSGQCGLWWLDPCPREADLDKLYAAYYTHEEATASERLGFSDRLRSFVKFGYDGGAADNGRWFAPVLQLLSRFTGFAFPPLISHLPPGPGRLLDVGCGNGDLLRAAQERGWEAEGLDFDPVAVEVGRARGLQVKSGTLASQHYETDAFDAIVMSHVIEHVADPIALLEECHRILKPGGRLLLATPNVDSQFHRRFGKHWFHLDPPRHLFLFGPHALKQAFTRAGFSKPPRCFTVLGVPQVYGASQLIQQRGQVAPSEARGAINALASVMMLGELIRIKTGHLVGEELRLVGEK